MTITPFKSPDDLAGTWHVENVILPGRERLEDRIDIICVGSTCLCSIALAGERSDADAKALVDLLGAAQDMRRALSAARRAIERATEVPCRVWVLSVLDAALTKANGGCP